MEIDNKEIKRTLPKSIISKYSFKDFKNLIEMYSNILSNILQNNKNQFFSRDDILIIKDLIEEIVNYSKELLNNNFINEGKIIIEIGAIIVDNCNNIYNKINKEKKLLRYPLKLKLLILEAQFNLFFKYVKDYNYSQEIILKIIEIQKLLELSKFNIGCSYFYLGLIYFFIKKYDESERIIKISQKLLTPLEFELDTENHLIKKDLRKYNSNKNQDVNNKKELIPYDISIRKSCNVLRVLGEIYLLKKDFINSINYIQNAYYLYFDIYGPNYDYTIFLKNKLISIFNKIKIYLPIDYKLTINTDNIKSKNNKNNKNQDLEKYKNNLEYKVINGKNKFYAFKIINTYLYQPMIISIYSLKNNKDNDIYSSINLIKTFYFNKSKLLNLFREDYANNAFFYSDKSIIKILNFIEYRNNKVFINNKNLKLCLMWNN